MLGLSESMESLVEVGRFVLDRPRYHTHTTPPALLPALDRPVEPISHKGQMVFLLESQPASLLFRLPGTPFGSRQTVCEGWEELHCACVM